MANHATTNELSEWKEKYYKALSAYSKPRENYKLWLKQFDGDKDIPGGKPATSVYNFTQELIEAQIDSSIPAPSVQPKKPTERNRELADIIMSMIKNELDRMPFEEKNDLDERVTRVMSGQLYLTEWDSTKSTHNTVGEIDVRFLSPMEIVPQESVYDPDKMDYFFIVLDRTKQSIKDQYGKDVSDEGMDVASDNEHNTDMTTQIITFYKKKGNPIGCISWAGDTLLVSEKNYFTRKDKVCHNCGKVQADGEKVCACGSKEWKMQDREFEVLTQDVVRSDGTIIPAMSPVMQNGELVYEDYEEPSVDPASGLPMYELALQDGMPMGEMPIMETRQRIVYQPTKIPYYALKSFPIAVRKNISAYQSFFGKSDCAIMRDQQLQSNKALTRIDQKIASVSNLFTKPRDLSFEINNSEINVLNVENPAQITMIKAISLQFDTMSEYNTIERAYYHAKSLLGITDTFQGKADPTATSGKAKEIQVAQAAGIQRSKRTMKNAAYAKLFENIFYFMLAFSNEPRTYTTMDENGQPVEKVFNRYDFLERDEWGNWYYCDEFLFSVDENGAMQTDKQFLLEDVRTDFNMGAFGDPQDPQTMLLYWKEKEVLGYPNAKRMVKHWQDKIEALVRVPQMTGGDPNAPQELFDPNDDIAQEMYQ